MDTPKHIPTFIQNSRINQVIYQIRDGQLWISERELWGKFKDRKIDLRQLDPDYTPLIARNYALLLIPLIGAVFCTAAIWGLWQQSFLPQEALFLINAALYVFLGFLLLAAIPGSRRIEYFQFNNFAGRPVLSIIREKEQAKECAAFITALVAHIELAQSDLSPEEHNKILSQLEADATATPIASLGPSLWKRSIFFGVLASGLPLVPNVEIYLPLFEITSVLCGMGAVCSVYSFMNKEPGRWWGIIGMVLSLIPPYFYQ
jgi:hypothetical protein